MKLAIVTYFLMLGALFGQVNVLSVKLNLNRKSYLAYEHVYAEVLITNNSAQEVRLRNSDRKSWLEFKISRNHSVDIRSGEGKFFNTVIVPAGQTVKFPVTLTSLYSLVDQGNYTIRARVNPPLDGWSSAESAPAFFNVYEGATLFSKQVGVPAARGKIVEYRVKVLNSVGRDQVTSLYFQTYDPEKKRITKTYSLGPYTGVNRPQFMIDGNGYLCTLFQVDAKLFRFLNIANTGEILEQTIHKIASKGIPKIIKRPDTQQVVVWNASLYDAELEAEKKRAIHNISQRPPFAY